MATSGGRGKEREMVIRWQKAETDEKYFEEKDIGRLFGTRPERGYTPSPWITQGL